MRFSHGNKCGHDKEFCRTYERHFKHKEPPPLILKAAAAMADFYHYCHKFLPRLKTVNGSTRQQKTERREGIVGVGQVLINYCDLATWRVHTHYKDESGKRYGVTEFIAHKLGYTIKRVQRALSDLKNTAYINIERDIVETEHGLRQRNRISLTRRLFVDLGFDNIFIETSRHYKHKSNAKRDRGTPQMKAFIKTAIPPPLSKSLLQASAKVVVTGNWQDFISQCARAT